MHIGLCHGRVGEVGTEISTSATASFALASSCAQAEHPLQLVSLEILDLNGYLARIKELMLMTVSSPESTRIDATSSLHVIELFEGG